MGLTTAWAQAAPKQNQRTFATPQEAIQATIEASEHNDTAALRQIFGPGSKDIVESGDPAQDKNDRAEFARLAREKVRVNQDPTNPDRVSLSVGNQDWPFPVLLVRKDGKWDFDSAAIRCGRSKSRTGPSRFFPSETSRPPNETFLS